MNGLRAGRGRRLMWGLGAGLALLLAADRGARTASVPNTAIDPFEILDLQVRANVIIVLDSSGSMREVTTAAGLVNGISNGELVGDDPNSKLKIAKDVLRTIVDNNKDKVSFQFGRYDQVVGNTVLATNDRYYYVTTQASAATLEINRTGNGGSAPGIKRHAVNDTVVIGGITHYYLVAQRFWNGETVTTAGVITTGATTNPATVTLTDGTLSATFTLAGPNFARGTGASCLGFQSLVPLAPCDQSGTMQFGNIEPYLDTEVDYDGTGAIVMAGAQPALTRADGKPVGVRAVGGTPIIGSLTDVRNNFWTGGANYWAGISAKPVQNRPKTFVIFVTDGDDQCAGGTGAANLDARARTAASRAQDLYRAQIGTVNADGTFSNATAGPTSSVQTFFIAFGGGAGVTRSNWVAWGGTGLGTWTDPSFNWATTPAATLDTWAHNRNPTPGNPGCRTCEDAKTATNAAELTAAIQAAIDKGITPGEFSSQTQGSVTESVFEYVALVPTPPSPSPSTARSATDPLTRLSSTFPITVRSTFTTPNFEGQLKAFSSTGLLWDAGLKLRNNLTATMGSGQFTFAELHGGASNAPRYTPATTARIRRRIFTNSGNGVNLTNVPLWPPTTTGAGAVAPDDVATYPAGSVDGSATSKTGLAIGGLTAAQLQSTFLACRGSVPANIPADCSNANADRRALKEAREMILAFTAGASVVLENGLPLRNGSGELLYAARTWLLAESTLATPAIVGPPGEKPTVAHANEWVIYRDGPRDTTNRLVGSNPVENGFGLRNPDRDDPSPSTAGDQEPIMTVVYLGANDMVHAFRAGPQGCTPTLCPATGTEDGGEELWGFVPYDLLPVLQKKLTPQTRANPNYMVASSIRFGDVFVPGTYTAANGVSFTGVWRTMMFFGRGPGGKHLTGMDITGVGPFPQNALDTQLPIVKWNRGNPDTVEGLSPGTANALSPDLGAVDATAYATMGETWSIPALVPIDKSLAFDVEWVLFVGSGFSDISGEGSTVYTIDVLTGDILYAVDVGSNSSANRTNFVPAAVVGFVPAKLDAAAQVNAADGPATSAFVGDLHGRMWRFATSALGTNTLLKDYGTDQPIGVAVAALNLNTDGVINKPHVYGVTGSDNRIFNPKAVPPLATPPFVMFGLRDDGSSITELFLPPGPVGFPERFRGTTQPLVGNVTNAVGDDNVVFFVGTQFNPAGTSTAPGADPCVSSFDTVLFALNAAGGGAAYDLQTGATDDRFAVWRGQKVQNVTSRDSKVVLDTGLNAGVPPPPPGPPTPQSNNALPSVFTSGMRFGSPVCNW